MATTTVKTCALYGSEVWSHEGDDDLRISDYRINEPKLRPRLAAIFRVEEERLEYTWINGTYVVKGVPPEKEIGQVYMCDAEQGES